MFREWLKNNNIWDYDFSGKLIPDASDREFWDGKFREGYVKRAENYLNYSWPLIKATDYLIFKQTGDREAQQEPLFARRVAICDLLAGEVAEYKKRFLPDIVNGVFAICEETFWGMAAELPAELNFRSGGYPGNPTPGIPDTDYNFIGLVVSDTAAYLAWIYYMLYDELTEYCPEILKRIEFEIERRVVKPYLHHRDFCWMGYFSGGIGFNWTSWIISNLISVFLLVEKRRAVQNEGIRKMMYEIQTLYNRYQMDGGCDEGASYWYPSAGSLFDFCDQLYLATHGRINFFDDEKFKNMAKYYHFNYIGNNYQTSFCDGSPSISPLLPITIYRFGERIGDRKIMGDAKDMWKDIVADKSKIFGEDINTGYGRKMIFAMAYIDKIADCPDPVWGEEEYLSESLEQSYVRSRKWYYAAKGGHNDEGHNHNDVGSFLVYYNNNPVLIDTGNGIYTAKNHSPQRYEIWYNQSSWHNLPEINGQMQKDGRKFAADHFSLENGHTGISFAGAYPKETGISSIKRDIRVTDSLEITDEFLFEKDNNIICENFITALDVRVEGNHVVLGEQYVLQTDGDVEILTDYMDNGVNGCWNVEKINRIIFKCHAGQRCKLQFLLKNC